MSNKTRSAHAVLSILMVLSLLLGACDNTTPGPGTAVEAGATGTTPRAGQPASTQEPANTPLPTATLPPTVTPMPLPAPRLAFHSPGPGEEQPLDAPLELIFDQPMEQDSVEAALSISPTLETTLTWSDERTLVLTPAEDLPRGQHYQVTVAETARNVEGEVLAEPISFEFDTVGFLSVSQVMPAPDTEELDPDTAVTVVFDRPIVPLTSIGQQAELPNPLTFVPPVRGTGEWLNTSIYRFQPRAGFLPGTHYKARVAAGLVDTSGGTLPEDYAWEFTTVRPAVLSFRPDDEFLFMGPSDVITVTFNQPMDRASTQSRFALQADDAAVPGTFRWRDGGETLVFVPDEPLPRNTTLTASLEEGAQARSGTMGLEKALEWRFYTVNSPGVAGTEPENGAQRVRPGTGLEITFASPMQPDELLDHVTFRPAVTEVYTYWSEFDTQVNLSWKQEPATQYAVTLDAGTPDKYGATLGRATTVRFTTGDLSPLAWLTTVARLSTYSAYTDTVAYASYRNVSRLDVSLYRLSLRTFIDLNTRWEAWDRFVPADGDLVREWSQNVRAPRNETRLARLELTAADGSALPPGLYYVELTAPEVEKQQPGDPGWRSMFVKSALNLTLKQTESEALVWATDLASGQPVSGLPINLYTTWGDVDARGTTGRDGLYLADDLQNKNLWDPFFAVSGEPGSDDFALAYNGWDAGISPWNFNVDSEFWSTDYQGYLYTDRPIYRPGQTVYFKGIVRADDDATYSLPADLKSVRVLVGDPQGKELFKKDLALNDMGTLYDELQLDEEATLGQYYLEMQAPEAEFYYGASFQVAEYRAPEFQVEVTTDRDAYLNGDRINAAAEATYYFGGPVADAAVRWSVLSSDYSFSYTCPQGETCPWYSWTDFEWGGYADGETYGTFGRLIDSGETRTDDEGRVTFRVPAGLEDDAQSQIFTVEAAVTDINNQEASSRTGVVVHKAGFYVGVAPRGYLAQVGERKQVDLLTVDWDGEPVSGVELSVVFMEHNWYSVRRQSEDGQFYWDWEAQDTPVYTTTVTTGAGGKAAASYVPRKAGSYRVRATGTDENGNSVRSSAYFWVWGGDEYVSWRQESNNRIQLIADKEEYEVGDVAEILIPSPYSGTVQALVTVERGHIVDTEVRELEGNSEVLRVPIVEEHVPNVFVSVVIVEGSDDAPDEMATFKMGLVKLPVSVASKELQITLTPDKAMEGGEHYTPRQTASYDLLVTDYKGNPVEAELSLRMADLAVLALADEQGPTLLDLFWRNRGLGVKTTMALVVAMEPFNREIRPEAKGGGGGEFDGLMRSRFADTAFWDPVVRTDEEGKAHVEVQLPDNLTTWRMQARGVTADTRVGLSNVDVLSTLDLLVRPVLPRFFVVDDQAEIATVVHNNTGQALDVEVNINVEGLSLEGDARRTVTVAAGDQAKVIWPVTVLPGDEVNVRTWARAGDLYDGREDNLPVYHYSTPEVVATAGQLSEAGQRQEVVQLPRVLDERQGELTVKVDGSLTAATQDALRYLEHYPYECVEQTVSRFLPNILTWRTLDEMGIERHELRQRLSQMVGVALQRLYAQQHYDGGWGWWVSDESDPYLTAYVLHGMLEAHRADMVVDEEAMTRAAGYLRDALPSVGRVDAAWQANRLAYGLYVLADYGVTLDDQKSGTLGLAVSLFEKRHLLDRYGQATLAMALGILEPQEPSRVQTLLGDLMGDAILSATGAHWEEAEPDYWNMNTDVRTTAIVLWAMSRLDPENDLLPNVVRWLMAVREEGHWESTQVTAWSLLGLTEYMRASGELRGDMSYSVYLNGQEWATGQVTEENIDEGQELQVSIARLLADEANRLVIQRQEAGPDQTGEGQLYYSAQLRYYLPVERVQALDRGIVVARQYSPVDSPGEFVDSAQVGDVIQVKLTLIAPTDLYYVVVEDPLPAGCEGVDMSLKTTSVVGQAPELRNLTAEEENVWLRRYGWGSWFFSQTELRDERAVLFATYLPRGTYEYVYNIRASVPGEFMVIPTTAYQMYWPEVFGRSDGARFTVRDTE